MPRKFERFSILALLLASPFWLPAVPSEVGSHLRLGLASVLKPAFQGVQVAQDGFHHLILGVLRGPVLLEETQLLRSQLETLQAHEQTHQQLAQENTRLRALLEFKARTAWQTVPAEVVAREMGLWSRTLLIDKGGSDGITVGMAVITPVGLVGRVSEVGPALSRVILLNDPHFRAAATVADSRIMGLVIGTSSGDCLLTYVPLDADLKAGQHLLAAGGKSFCPAGVPIGVIQSVGTDSSQLFRSARIRPSVGLGALEKVLVVAWPSSDSGSSF